MTPQLQKFIKKRAETLALWAYRNKEQTPVALSWINLAIKCTRSCGKIQLANEIYSLRESILRGQPCSMK